MLKSIIGFIIKWSIGVAVMTCDIIFDVSVSILVLLETIVIELFSIICVLVIDVWKKDDVVEPNNTPTRDVNTASDDDSKEDNDTTSNTGSTDTNQTSESGSGSGSDDLRVSYRHLKQEYTRNRKESRTQVEIVGSQVIF